MDSIKHDELILEIHTQGDSITNLWKGASRNLKPAEFFTAFFEKLIGQARGKKLIIDFSALEIMNSSTIRFLISFFTMLEEASIPTDIFYDLNSTWQPPCFKPISIMIQGFKHITIHAKSDAS